MTTQSRQSQFSRIPPKERLPKWIKPSIGRVSELEKVQGLVKKYRLNTICEEGRCPNRGECYAAGTATFLLGGSICTRSCSFCQVDKGSPNKNIDYLEAERIANAVFQMGLRYVVLTSVARDDLSDHGASLFCKTMKEIRKLNTEIDIEVLTPDFWGGGANKTHSINKQRERLMEVLRAKPVCFNHNLETVERLQKEVRRGATYTRSLGLLKAARELAPNIPTKSGLMLGLGETKEEIIKTLEDLRSVDCQYLTLGQYLRPSLAHIPVAHYWEPKDFVVFASEAKKLGFKRINSGPLVRSSYHAEES
ncbi:lipoyl synthase [Prochlorococcus sp. MIT 1307]|uniref:lipoyl synthase n=1 Tax=Prochlorococcus sp. MIT 1307 TaxID=3096219 RepID=UPI002A765D49|nr:lipoyl synthase [Prochlorococcus sp. MIT 1307]